MLITIIFLSLIGLGLIFLFSKMWKVETEVHTNFSPNGKDTAKLHTIDEFREKIYYIYPDSNIEDSNLKDLINNVYKTLNTLYPYKVKKARKEARESFTPQNGWSKPLSEINTRAYVINQLRYEEVPVNIKETKSICFNYNWDDSWACVLGLIFGLVGIVGSLACAGVIMGGRLPLCVENKKVELNNKINELKRQREKLLHYEDSGVYSSANIIQATHDYNWDVQEFHTEIKTRQNSVNNIWVSWFNNPAYSTIDITEVESLYI